MDKLISFQHPLGETVERILNSANKVTPRRTLLLIFWKGRQRLFLMSTNLWIIFSTSRLVTIFFIMKIFRSLQFKWSQYYLGPTRVSKKTLSLLLALVLLQYQPPETRAIVSCCFYSRWKKDGSFGVRFLFSTLVPVGCNQANPVRRSVSLRPFAASARRLVWRN